MLFDAAAPIKLHILTYLFTLIAAIEIFNLYFFRIRYKILSRVIFLTVAVQISSSAGPRYKYMTFKKKIYIKMIYFKEFSTSL